MSWYFFMIVRAPQFYFLSTVIENSIFLSQSSFDLMIFYGYHFLNNKHKNRVKKGRQKLLNQMTFVE